MKPRGIIGVLPLERINVGTLKWVCDCEKVVSIMCWLVLLAQTATGPAFLLAHTTSVSSTFLESWSEIARSSLVKCTGSSPSRLKGWGWRDGVVIKENVGLLQRTWVQFPVLYWLSGNTSDTRESDTLFWLSWELHSCRRTHRNSVVWQTSPGEIWLTCVCLLIPNRDPTIGQSEDITSFQLGEPWALWLRG